jgi:agmatinase
VGDVLVVPQLLHDDMLSEAQKEATRQALYPGHKQSLPVSPLSVSERVFELLFALNPSVKVFLLGGDHSCAWPLAKVLSQVGKSPWGIVQPDAHTDLLEARLGVRYCFATWSYHANRLLGGNGRLTQVGTRASAKTKAHWEDSLGVRQFWAEEVLQNPDRALEAIVAHVRSTGVKAVYLSNDIDGTDSHFADATGTPEPLGLTPDFVVELIRRLGKDVGLCAADIMEVAPSLQRTPDGAQRTVSLAVRYMKESLAAML